jgi:hypothetical protein
VENPIDKDKITETPSILPYAHTVGGAIIRPDDMGKIKSNALLAMEQQTDMQLKQIQEQINLLFKQATAIKERSELSVTIYQSQMGFDPLIGHVYHLYEKDDGSHFLSMIGPEEWGRSKKFERHVAKVKLLADHTWDVL